MALLRTTDREKLRVLCALAHAACERGDMAEVAHHDRVVPHDDDGTARGAWLRRNIALMKGNQPMLEAHVILLNVGRILDVEVSPELLAAWHKAKSGLVQDTANLGRICNHPYAILEEHVVPSAEKFGSGIVRYARHACVACGYDQRCGNFPDDELRGLRPDSDASGRMTRWARGAFSDDICHVVDPQPPLPEQPFDAHLAEFLALTDFDDIVDKLAGRLACTRVASYLANGLPPEIDYETAGL